MEDFADDRTWLCIAEFAMGVAAPRCFRRVTGHWRIGERLLRLAETLAKRGFADPVSVKVVRQRREQFLEVAGRVWEEGLVKYIQLLLDRCISLLRYLGMILIILMVLQVTLDVILRYTLNAPLPGTIMFVSLFYMTAIAFFPLGDIESRNAHISVEIFTEMMPARVQAILALLTNIIALLVLAGLAVRTGMEAVNRFHLGQYVIEGGLTISTWPTYFFLPVGFGLAAVAALVNLLRWRIDRRSSHADLTIS